MEGEDIPEPTCDDLKEWDIEVEELANGIIWDADYGKNPPNSNRQSG